MIQLVIFDFDGTIANTLEATVKIYNKIASKHGLKKIKPYEIDSLRDLGARELIRKFKVSTLKIPFLIREFRSNLKKDIQNILPVEGIDQVFRDLKRKKIRTGIVTSNSKENVQLFLKEWGITNVDFIHSESSLFGKGKVLSHVVQQQGISRKETIYVGDEVRDIEAAHDVRVAIIAVSWGFNSKKRLIQSKPDYLISKPKEILKIINHTPEV